MTNDKKSVIFNVEWTDFYFSDIYFLYKENAQKRLSSARNETAIIVFEVII